MKNDKAKTTKKMHVKTFSMIENTKNALQKRQNRKKPTQKTRNDFVRVTQRATTTKTPKVHGKHMQNSLGRLKGMIFGSTTETTKRERESKHSSHETIV